MQKVVSFYFLLKSVQFVLGYWICTQYTSAEQLIKEYKYNNTQINKPKRKFQKAHYNSQCYPSKIIKIYREFSYLPPLLHYIKTLFTILSLCFSKEQHIIEKIKRY